MSTEHRLHVRVRYVECDPMGIVHHSAYPVWLEMARTEMCRATGVPYAELARDGLAIAVTRLEMIYRAPARYDDELEVVARVTRATRVKLEHAYRILRDGVVLTEASSTVACVGPDGRPRPLPPSLQSLGSD